MKQLFTWHTATCFVSHPLLYAQLYLIMSMIYVQKFWECGIPRLLRLPQGGAVLIFAVRLPYLPYHTTTLVWKGCVNIISVQSAHLVHVVGNSPIKLWCLSPLRIQQDHNSVAEVAPNWA